MLQLVYVSEARPGLGAGDFEALLNQARWRNRQDDVTSMLIYDGQRFLQALEGPDTAVERCFARIAQDTRHSGAEVLFLRTVLARAFGTWDLQFHRLDSGYNGSATTLIKTLAARLPDPAMRSFVVDFCQIQRWAA